MSLDLLILAFLIVVAIGLLGTALAVIELLATGVTHLLRRLARHWRH